MSAVTGSTCEMLVCMKLLLFIVGAEPGAAATTNGENRAENKETKSATNFLEIGLVCV